ncbi:unnamed protein product [Urochloa humidicola]
MDPVEISQSTKRDACCCRPRARAGGAASRRRVLFPVAMLGWGYSQMEQPLPSKEMNQAAARHSCTGGKSRKA